MACGIPSTFVLFDESGEMVCCTESRVVAYSLAERKGFTVKAVTHIDNYLEE
jgi:hypothetical protein